jgi:hypothetical protein
MNDKKLTAAQRRKIDSASKHLAKAVDALDFVLGDFGQQIGPFDFYTRDAIVKAAGKAEGAQAFVDSVLADN